MTGGIVDAGSRCGRARRAVCDARDPGNSTMPREEGYVK
jgi:hypothetical protein